MKLLFIQLLFCCVINVTVAQRTDTKLSFTVSVPDPAKHIYHVTARYEGVKEAETTFKLPSWTPGYYQIMDYAKNVEQFVATDVNGTSLTVEKPVLNTWKVKNGASNIILLSYDIKAERAFVAANFVDAERGYLSPAGVFVYPEGKLKHTSTITIDPYSTWTTVATGLEPVKGKKNTFYAPDFDVLFDSPFLMGSNLEALPPFQIEGKTHNFVGYKLGEFDKPEFMDDLKKVITSAAAVIGDIPYNHYTFLAIGPGGGGIEHLNSTSISFSGQGLSNRSAKIKMYNFLAHEYFHHYNVKRIRPVELGPFNYDKGSRTNMLWVSEGLTVYYEYIVLRRAGLTTEEEMLNGIRTNILAYENKPGHLYQSLAQSSYETWSDGPFGRTGDEVNKTISYYDKGPVVGAMLDFKIRHETKNKYSLDDVMRAVYKEYYQQKKRGFTEDEFKAVCEKIAGTSLNEFFEYIYTVKDPDYVKYFGYAGLDINVTPKLIPAYFGGVTRERNDSVSLSAVDWQSPAWNAGLRSRDIILEVNNARITSAAELKDILDRKKTGDEINLVVLQNNNRKDIKIVLGTKSERTFEITRKPSPNALQDAIYKDWIRGTNKRL